MIKKFEEYIESGLDEVVSRNINEDDMLLEMARIDDPDFDSTILGNIEVWIYGGDRTPMTPHFHVFDKDFNREFEDIK